jgi:hypothetical protein
MTFKEVIAKYQFHALVLGLLVQLVGYYSTFKNLLSDPLTAILTVGVGYLLIATYCCLMFLSRKEGPAPTPQVEPGKPRLVFAHSGGQRALAAAIFVAATLGFVVFVVIQVKAATAGRVVQGSELNMDKYAERSPLLSMVDIYDAGWTGGGAKAILKDGHFLPLAWIEPKPETSRFDFGGSSCAVSFKIEAKKSYSWLSLDKIVAEVQRYEPLPEYWFWVPRPYQEAEVLYLELSPPTPGRTRFEASILPSDKSKESAHGYIRIDSGKPDEIAVLINATTPGIYTFSVSLLLSAKREHEIVRVIPETSWLFIHDVNGTLGPWIGRIYDDPEKMRMMMP